MSVEAPGQLGAAIRKGLRRWASSLRTGLCAVAAWVITVAPLSASVKASPVERVLAALALLMGVCAPVLARHRPRLARHLGITGFVGLFAVLCVLSSLSGSLAKLDGYRSALGAVAWGLYALSWSHPWSVPDAQLAQALPRVSGALEPRRRLSWLPVGIAAGGALCAKAAVPTTATSSSARASLVIFRMVLLLCREPPEAHFRADERRPFPARYIT